MIELGQDALGDWAWMLFSRSGDLIASGSGCGIIEIAIMQATNAWIDARRADQDVAPTRDFYMP